MRTRQQLNNFSLSIVKNTAKFYNKAFHAKVFTLFASSESEVYTFSKMHKPNYGFCFAFMQQDQSQWYLDTRGIQKVRHWIINKAKTNPKPIFDLYAKWQKDWKIYLKMAKIISNQDLKKFTNQQLYSLFEKFYQQYLKVGAVAYIADSFMSTGTEDWLESLISFELSKQGIKKPDKIKLVRQLTSPVHFSFILAAECRMLKIASQLPKKTVSLARIKNQTICRQIKRIEKDYYWLQNNYYNVHYISAKEFYQQIVELKKQGNVTKRLKQMQNELAAMRQERQALINTLGLSSFIKNVLRIARLFAKWKDVRKSGVYIGMHYFDNFLSEIAVRTGYTKKQLTFTVFNEIKQILFDGSNIKKEIADRQKKLFFSVTPKGYYLAGGQSAARYFKVGRIVKIVKATEIRGVSACPGQVKGRVRVIKKTQQMKNFKKGEILVTNQTTPEFVPIMKRAAAVITEQGGITSHAAIVSRELGIPCVIGTKVATKVFKNGDIVEVDANKGIIKKLV